MVSQTTFAVLFSIGLLMSGYGGFQAWSIWPLIQDMNSPIGQTARLLSPSLEQQFRVLQNNLYAYVASTIIGAVICLGSMIFSSKRKVESEKAVEVEKDETLDIARRRLASGEITIEEFEKLIEKLQ